VPQGFDPTAGLAALTSTAANGTDADRPFVGLATPVSVDPRMGTATTRIPIAMPPGRKGMAPELAVTYSSNQGNGPVGLDWQLSVGSVQRSTRSGLRFLTDVQPPTYNQADGFVLLLNGTAVESGRLRPHPWRAVQ
jgi:hypothetical protein